MPDSNIAVSVRGLCKSYTIAHELETHVTLAETMLARLKNPLRQSSTETFWALKDINFDIKKGDVVGIIGRNGAGKSTLLKILSRITEPTAGRIDLYGRVGSLLEVGTGFHPELTGRENIFLNGAILGMSKAEIKKQFDAIVDFAGVEQFLDTPVKRYSSGMYVRLAFAVAAHLRSDILIIDEVLAVGDKDFQDKCIGKISQVSVDGRTAIVVSHNMGSVKKLCSSALLLQHGKLLDARGVDDCIALYTSIYGTNQASRIIDRVDYISPRMRLNRITVNGSESRTAMMTGTHRLAVRFEGELLEKSQLNFEANLMDSSGQKLAFASAGHIYGESSVIPRGHFDLSWNIAFPENVNEGRFYVGMYLTEPDVAYWTKIPQALELEFIGQTTSRGRALSYSKGDGFLLLDCRRA